MRRRHDGEPRLELLGHRPSLDGLRALAFLGVFTDHAALVQGGDPGAVAMFLFFSLSGFLITSLIVRERWATGRFSLWRFLARRALRLLPALLLFLVVWFLVVLAFGQQRWITRVPGSVHGGSEPIGTALQAIGAAAGYFLNWVEIFHLFGHYVPIAHLWSLSVEEQFYLVWAPLLAVLLAWRLRAVQVVAVLLAASSLIELPLLYDGGRGELRIYMGTDTRAAAFVLGGALAVFWCRGGVRLLRRGMVGTAVAGVASAALVWALTPLSETGALLAPSTGGADFFARWIVSTLAAPLLVVAAASLETGLVRRLLSGRTLTYIGRRSYALYLWHYAWLTWMHSLGLLGVGVALAASFLCAEFSWRLVESRALSLKSKLAPASDPLRRELVAASRVSAPR